MIVYPVVYSVYVSFTPFHLLRPETTFVFKTETMFRNYTKLAGDRVFWKSVLNTVIFLAVTVNLSFLISLALSQLMARVTRGQSIMRTLLMVPMMFAPVLVGFQFAWFFNATVGLVNNAAHVIGIDVHTQSLARRSAHRHDIDHDRHHLDECPHDDDHPVGGNAFVTTRYL